MARRKQKSAFLCAVQEMPETTGDILEDVWGGLVAIGHRIWRPVAARPILWFLMIYFGLITAAIGWRYAEGNSGGFGILNWAFWEKPSGQSESGAALNGTEGIRNLVWSLATLVGGAAAGIGLILAARRTKAANDQAEAALQQSETAFQSLVTERFTRAVEQLGHEKRAVRLGAIYALERIAKDSPRDRDTIVETLAAYIREHAPWKPPSSEDRARANDDIENEYLRPIHLEQALEGIPRLAGDIGAALKVICGLLPPGDPIRKKVDLRQTDLSRLDIPSINLSEINLIDVNLYGASLRDVKLYQAQMQRAVLDWADLLNADMSGADLEEVQLLTQKQIDGIRYHRDHPPKNLPAGLTLPEPYDL